MSAQSESAYVGTELDLFAHAKNWKDYWGSAIRSYLGPHVLDVGAGKGATARLLNCSPVQRWLALEPDARLAACIRDDVAAGRIPANCEVQVGTIASLSAEDMFDSILYIDVLEHIDHDRDELAAAARHLKPSGRIVVLAPAHNWLFAPFDTAVGHYRRYNSQMLQAATPDDLVLDRVFYLDSVGMLASIANRVLLRSAHPTVGQIRFWDGWLVPASRVVDPVLGNRIGKSIVGIWRRSDER